MKYRVTYFIGSTNFIFETDSVADLYNAVTNIICQEITKFPDADSACCEYLTTCAKFAAGELTMLNNYVFRIERINRPPDTG